MTRKGCRTLAFPLALVLLGTPGLKALEGEVNLTLNRTLVAVVASPPGPPGTPAQEVGADRARVEAVVGHQQSFGGGLTAEATGRMGLDTLPSETPLKLPDNKLTVSATLLEAWLGWEPLPGALTLGLGKRRIQPSSGFSHKPLDELARTDEREGRTGAQVSWFGESLSASVFAGPPWPQDGTADGFVLGRLGATLGSADLKTQVVHRAGVSRVGVGFDGSWGDHLTLRAEAAADTSVIDPREDALAGVTWTTDDLSTLMLELVWDDRKPEAHYSGFVRGAMPLDEGWEAQAWFKAEVTPARSTPSGWTGLNLTWEAPHWTMEAGWTGAWGPAGDQPVRWKTDLTAKVFLP